MELKNLWKGYRFPKCKDCKKECVGGGHLKYDNLCSNLNYLHEYAEKNYKKNKNSFELLKDKTELDKPNIFSFGCGIGLDCLGAKEVFENVNYFGIDECDWEIKNTENYKNFEPNFQKP